jgi:transglutaminase-like putative cysteine protease
VCQDFAHIMIALVRGLGIPCRYVSGYLFQQNEDGVRSSDGATHAWLEVLLPDLGWIGFDPTNNLMAGRSHIRVAIGRDYADVPPTRGVYKGVSAVRTELAVGVSVGPALAALSGHAPPFVPWMSRDAAAPLSGADPAQSQQQ